jgi:hypothetical protein
MFERHLQVVVQVDNGVHPVVRAETAIGVEDIKCPHWKLQRPSDELFELIVYELAQWFGGELCNERFLNR